MTETLSQNLKNGYSVKIGNYLGRGWDLFKSNMGSNIGFIVVYFVISTILGLIPFLGNFASLALAPLMYGIYLVNRNYVYKKQIPEFGDYFKGYEHAMPIIVISALSLAIALGLAFAGIGSTLIDFINGDKTYESLMELVEILMEKKFIIIVLLILASVLGLIFQAAIFIAVFHRESIIESIKQAAQFVFKNPLMLFLFSIVNGFVAIIGFLGLFFAILITLPWSMCSTFCLYEDLLGLPEQAKNQDEDLIGTIGSI